MNSWRSPQGVRFRHFPDQISHLGAHSGTAGSPAPGDPGPVKPEPSSRPAHDRLWVDNQQGPSPVTPNPGQPDPKPAVHLSQPRSRTLPFHHRQLLTEGQILQSQFLDVRRGQKETKDRKQELEHADEYHGCVGESQLFSGGSNSDEPQEVVFAEGDPCQGLYVIESGTVRIFKTSASGREQVLTVEGPGSSIAELPVFDGGAYPASAAAASPASLLFISKNDFQALCLQHPQVALKVLRVVGARLRGLVSIIEELSFTTVRHRLLALLLREASEKGKETNLGIEFTLTTSNQELAFQIGTVRELVSRNLSRLQAAGLLKMEGKRVIIPDVIALEKEVATSE